MITPPSIVEQDVAELIAREFGWPPMSPEICLQCVRARFGDDWINHPERGSPAQQQALADFVAGR